MKAYYSIDLNQPTHQARVGMAYEKRLGTEYIRLKKTKTIDTFKRIKKMLADQFGSENVIEGEDPLFPTRKTLTVK